MAAGAGPAAEGFGARTLRPLGAQFVAPEFRARELLSSLLRSQVLLFPLLGFRLLQRGTMVVLRNSLLLHDRSVTDSLDLSSEFLSLQDSGGRQPSLPPAAGKSTASKAAAAAGAGVSTGLGREPWAPGWRLAEGTRAPRWGGGLSRTNEVEGSGKTELAGSGLSKLVATSFYARGNQEPKRCVGPSRGALGRPCAPPITPFPVPSRGRVSQGSATPLTAGARATGTS